ncbi:translocation protein Sec62 [Cooperia oncophora]
MGLVKEILGQLETRFLLSVNPEQDSDEDATLSKEQDAVARYVRFNCPTSTTMFQGNEVQYFTGSKAIDTLMESKYGSKAKNEAAMLFPNRQAAVNYMRELMTHQLFFHARKLVPKKKEDKEKKDKGKLLFAETGKPTKSEKDEKKKKEDETVTETEAEDKKDDKKTKDSDEKKTKEEEEKKKKKKVKLEVHDVQVFNDDKDVYVWVFDPTPLYKKIIGLCMVLGTIVGCLFPLWPMWLRQGVYYLSLAGISLFGVIVVVAILRTILFGIIWLATMGQHKLWILPNLTEDCGFFESFQPWYTYEYCPRDKKGKDAKKKKQKKAKESDDEKEDQPEGDDDQGDKSNASQGSHSGEPSGSEKLRLFL